MQALLPMFASERWLARLAASAHRTRFVLKGGVLLAALGNRRPTQDADLLALNIANDHDTVGSSSFSKAAFKCRASRPVRLRPD